MLFIRTLFIHILIISALALSAQTDPEIYVEELEKHVYYLASDSLKGRKPGTPESKLAAEYIRDQFIEIGLEPLGEDGFQYFDVVMSVQASDQNELTFDGVSQEMGVDFYPRFFSSNDILEKEVVFAGFGLEIDHDSLKWNDYKDLDVEGKWVMVLKRDPEPDNDKSLFISYSSDRDKALLARDKKAAGIIYVKGPQFGSDSTVNDGTFSRVTAEVGIAAINISRGLANQLISNQEKTINTIEKEIITSQVPLTFETGKKLYAHVDLERVIATTQNIIAVIEGNDPELKSEFIVVGAHYDHLGFGGPGSGSRMPDTLAIHNGADDNASGTAGLIELAGKLYEEKDFFKRSVVFMAFGAEEMGLLGSQFFVSNPLIDLKDVKAMINFDMIGRLDPINKSIMLAGTGTAVEMESMLYDFEVNNESLKFAHSPEGYGASDHASFYASGVPVLFFSTGAHEDYHTPFDDAHKINYAGEKEILDYGFIITMVLINRDENLTYNEAGPKKQREGYGRGLKVKFGIMPDFTSKENNGLGVGGVTQGGPASSAGMLKGDRITAIDGLEVTNIYDYMNRLKKLKPGQTVSVDIVREGQKKVLVVVL